MPTNVENFGSCLNELIEKRSISLHVFNSRYGDGAIAFLCTSEEVAERIIDRFTGGDGYYEEITSYLRPAPWFPIVYGRSAIDALDKMLEFVGQPLVQQNVKLWVTAVERAGYDLFKEDHMKHLPADINVYMEGW